MGTATRPTRAVAWLLALAATLAGIASPARGEELPEYRLKAAFLYNFALYTEWPAQVGDTLKLCTVGRDPFGRELEALQGKPIGLRRIAVEHRALTPGLVDCALVYVAPSAIIDLAPLLELLRGHPVLTVADSVGAAHAGVMVEMVVQAERVGFEVNLQAAHGAGLGFSSKLLRLAAEVYQ
jgi:hypothetical protein